ncbi:hypothetical protein [Nannocystis pusilla]|uniref:hypothetical protein n=1 Tax=Nannocystis pusilla TaxID=889268 RepID=UPI003B81214B
MLSCRSSRPCPWRSAGSGCWRGSGRCCGRRTGSTSCARRSCCRGRSSSPTASRAARRGAAAGAAAVPLRGSRARRGDRAVRGRPPAPEGPVALGATHHHEGAAGLFLGIEGGVARFGADLALLDDPGGITATLAHEVAHAYRSHHALCVEDRDLEEELTDMTAVFLGFGVLSANAALRHTSEQIYDGTFRSRWSVQRLGYLSPQELCFVLAAQVHARGAGREAVQACLGTNQASYFRAALRWLERERPALVSELGLPPRASWPPPDSVATLTRALDDTHDELERDEPVAPAVPEKVSNAGRPVFRVWRRSRADQAALGLPIAIAGLIGCVAAAMVHEGWIAAVIVVTVLAVRLAGRRRRPCCSEPECQAQLSRAERTCPGCGGTIAGDIGRAEERLAAEEALRLRSGG